jgi:hypothetical protein
MRFTTIVFAGRRRGGAHDLIRGLVVALVEQFSREDPPHAPPLVGVLQRHAFRRRGQDDAARFQELFLPHQPLDAAQQVAKIALRIGRDGIQPVGGLVVASFDGAACFHDRNRVIANTARSAHRCRHVLCADHLVHARLKIVAIEHVAEDLEHVRLGAFGQFFRAERGFRDPLGADAVAFAEQRTRQREPALCGQRLIGGEGVHGRRIGLLLPQMRLGAPAQQDGAGPFGIIGDERDVTLEMGERIRMAQDEPFGEFLRSRVTDGFRGVGRVAGLGAAGQLDHVLHDGGVAGEFRRVVLGRFFLVTRLLVALSRMLRVLRLLVLLRLLFLLWRVLALVAGQFRLLLVLGFLVTGGEGVARSPGESRQNEQTRQRPEQLDHSVLPL